MSETAEKHTGTIVVGGGLAGLAAAAYLARGGRSVTLLERAPTLGGRAATDTPGGYALNRGAHALYTGGSASEVLRELGVRYTSGTPRHILALDARGLHPFPSTPRDLLRTDLLTASDKRELVTTFLRLGTLRSISLAHQSVADWIRGVARRPRVRQLLTAIARVYVYSSALDIVSADVFVAKLQQTLSHPIHYVDGGWQTLASGMRDVAVAAGARVLTSAGVAGVQVHNGRAQGVRLQDGSVLPADEVVLALTPPEAEHALGSRPGSQLQRLVANSMPAHLPCLDLALHRLPAGAHPVVFDLEQPRFMTVQSQFARLAPDGGAVIHAFKQPDPRGASDPHQDRAELEEFMDQLQPGWRDVVVERRFLPRMLGAGLLPLASQGGLAGRPAHRSEEVSNVYFAGDWVGPRGYLVDASLDSAREAARLILREHAAHASAAEVSRRRAA